MSDVLVTGVMMLLSSAGGYVLANMEKWRENWQENKRRRRDAIGRVLFVLLAVHEQAAMYRVINELIKSVPSSDVDVKRFAVQLLETLLPDLTLFDKEYEEAIRSLAGEFPVLASDVRDSHRTLARARLMVSTVTSQALVLGATETALEEYSELVHATAFVALDRKVQELATQHGVTTQNEVVDLRTRVRRMKRELVMTLEAKLPLWTRSLDEEDREQARQLVAAWRESLPPGGVDDPAKNALQAPGGR